MNTMVWRRHLGKVQHYIAKKIYSSAHTVKDWDLVACLYIEG